MPSSTIATSSTSFFTPNRQLLLLNTASSLLKTLCFFYFAPVTLASLVTTVATSASSSVINGWQIFDGQAPGGPDLCSGILFGCAQGYVTNGTNPGYIAFNRIVSQSSQKPDDGAYLQLRDCMTTTKVGQEVVNAITETQSNAASGTANAVCAAETSVWQGWQVTSTTQSSKIPFSSDACDQYKNGFFSLGQNCESWVGAVKQYAKWFGIAAGIVAVVAIAGYIGYKCHERYQREGRCCNSTDHDNSSVSYGRVV